MTLRLLDLYCGEGGAAVGYDRAGVDDITGVDCEPMPRYPFRFVQADALEYLAEHWQEYDLFHASPVCKGYSVMNNLPWLRGKEYPLHILPIREAFEAIGKPYVIENVMGARFGAKGLAKRGLEAHGMKAGWLCGSMFGLPLYRHRLFETSFFWLAPAHPKHTLNLHPRSERWVYGGTVKGLPGGMAGFDAKPRKESLAAWQQGNGAQKAGVAVGHAKGWRLAATAMGVEWMDRDGTSQAIPPIMTEYIGGWLLRAALAAPPDDGVGGGVMAYLAPLKPPEYRCVWVEKRQHCDGIATERLYSSGNTFLGYYCPAHATAALDMQKHKEARDVPVEGV